MSVESNGDSAQGGPGGAPSRLSREEAVREVTRLLEPEVAAAGFDLEEVDVRPAGRRRLVKVVVDVDGGVSLDDITDLSRLAEGVLDASEVMGTASYVLEVTSPGVDRPLTEPRHWRRAVGRLVVAPLTGGGQVEGRVVAAGDDEIVLDVVPKPQGKGSKGAKGPKGGGKATRRRFGLDELGRGRVQVEFRRIDEPERDEPGEPDDKRSPAQPE
ncbi:ribosome maturation factor RimP [Spirillospora sp. CA-294931]|uniref:ribosome maturation factor RimP n=1 Tax=Spirillospora sp. CA-294931 TaxID=3240042 RepID=UPI003D900282